MSVTVAPSGTVKGIVTDLQSNPVDNVSLTLTTGNTNLFGFTDIAGNFQIDGVTPGSYTLIAEDFAKDRRARVFGTIAEGQANIHLLILDGTLPSIVSTDPAKGARDIRFDSTIHVVFNELMEPSSIQNAFLLISPSGSVAGNLVQNGVEWIFTPSAQLKPQTTYTILISKAAEDLAGNTLADDYIATFTTLDNVIPTLINSIPVDKAFNVPTNTKLQLFFSETIQNAGTYSITRIPDGPPLTIATETWNLAHTSVTLTFSGPLVENERITFTITGFTDTSGNSNSASLFFDTIDTAPPANPTLSASANLIIEGRPVTITAGVSESPLTVDFYIKGILRFHDTSAPFIYDVPPSLTTIESNGGTTMLVEASATDRSGNTSGRTALPITLIPDLPPQISIDPQPSPGDIYAGQTIRVNYTASDEGAIKKVLIIVSGALNLTLDAGESTSGFKDVALPSTLDNGSVVVIKARATDDSGKSTSTPEVSYTIAPDTTPPILILTQPAGGFAEVTEGDRFLVAATATDAVGVAKVELSFNGLTITDTTVPYIRQFITPPVDQDTSIVGTVKAFDIEGNSSQVEFTILVKVSDDPTRPTIEFDCPTNGLLYPPNYTLQLRVHVTDDDNVQKVEFYREAEETPFAVVDNIARKDTAVTTTDVLSGLNEGDFRQYTAVVYDFAGNSAAVTTTMEIVEGNHITSNEFIDATNPYQDQTIIVHNGATLTITGDHSFADVVVLDGGKITHRKTTNTTEFKLHLTANRVSIDCGGSIDAYSLGYQGRRTYPNTTVGGTNGEMSGGSYGGKGSQHGNDFIAIPYGNLFAPDDSGSGGGCTVADGGGVIGIQTDSLFVDGFIFAGGETGRICSNDSGGAGGGSIQISTQTISGHGSINASADENDGGGGGRISIHYDQDFMSHGIETHLVSNGGRSPIDFLVAGGAGTIYLFQNGVSTYGRLIVDNTRAIWTGGITKIPSVGTGVIQNTNGNVITALSDEPGWTEFPHSVVGVYVRILNADDSTFGEFKVLSQSGNTLTLEGLASDTTGLRYRGVLKLDSLVLKGGVVWDAPDYEDQPPTVLITSPVAGASFVEGTSVPISVDAVDEFGVTNVEFLAEGVVVGSDSTAPYAFSYIIPFGSASTLTLGARAYDTGGHITTADEVVINVTPEQVPPTVAITSPLSGSDVAEGTSLEVDVDASDNFAVASVELFVDGQSAGTDTTAPYKFTIVIPAEPTITLYAVATDARGNTATSSNVILNVVPATVQLMTPLQGQQLEQNADVYAMATAISAANFNDYYFLINGVRVDPLPATKQGDVLQFVAPFTVPASDTVTIEAVAVAGAVTASQSIQCDVRQRPDPFRVLYSLPADGETQAVFTNDWTSPTLTVKFSTPLNESQDFTGKVDLLQNGSAIPTDVSVSGDVLQIQANLIPSASYALSVQNIESSTGEFLSVPYGSMFTTAANIIYVDQQDPNAVLNPPCGTLSATPCRKIGDALLTAQPNDAVLIKPLLYDENLILPPNISLSGVDQSVTVVGNVSSFAQTSTDHFAIRNLGIQVGLSSNEYANIYLSSLVVQQPNVHTATIDILETSGNPGTISILDSQIISGGFDTHGIVLNLSGDQNTQIQIKDNQISAFSGIGIYVDDLDDGGGMHAMIERNKVNAITGIQLGDITCDVLENQLSVFDSGTTGLAFFPGKYFVYRNTIRGQFNSGISSFTTAFISNNDLSGSFDSGITGFDTIHYQNAIHDSQFTAFGIVSFRGQVLSNQVVNNNGNGSYLVDAIGGGNIFRKSAGLGIQQASLEFGFFEFNRIEACTAEGATVENLYGDFGGGFFGSRGGNIFLNNALNLGNASSATIDARNNSWDQLPPAGTFGAMNTDPATVITPEPDPPDVSFITPTGGEIITGNQALLVRISATDATGIASLGVSFDSGPPVYQSVEPYEVVIPAGQIFTGSHTITVQAFDVWNNQTTLTITVNAN